MLLSIYCSILVLLPGALSIVLIPTQNLENFKGPNGRNRWDDSKNKLKTNDYNQDSRRMFTGRNKNADYDKASWYFNENTFNSDYEDLKQLKDELQPKPKVKYNDPSELFAELDKDTKYDTTFSHMGSKGKAMPAGDNAGKFNKDYKNPLEHYNGKSNPIGIQRAAAEFSTIPFKMKLQDMLEKINECSALSNPKDGSKEGVFNSAMEEVN